MTLITLRTLLDAMPAPLPFGATLSVQRWANGAPATVIDGDAVTFPAKLAMHLDSDAAPIDVPPTDGRYCIRWVISVPPAYNVPPVVRHTSIPNVGPVEFADLTDVDPATFAPTHAVVGAWHDAIATMRQLLDQAEDATAAAHQHEEAADRHADAARGYAGDAAARASDADALATAAAGYATDADRSAGAAEEHAGAASESASAADEQRIAAEAAAAIAAAGQFFGTNVGAGVNADTLIVPGVYRFSAAASQSGTNHPFGTTAGVIEVFQILTTTGNAIIQRATPYSSAVSGRVFWERQSNGSSGFSTTAWRAYTACRIDQTAGRAMLAWDYLNGREQLVYGDTGWRDISAPLLNSWSASSLWIRRVGSLVTLKVGRLSGAAATSAVISEAVLQNGFKRAGSGILRVTVPDGDTSSFKVLHVRAAGLVSGAGYGAGVVIGASDGTAEVTWTTTDTWPTTLPGVAVGSVPNA